MKRLISFIKSICKELSPFQNIKILHTNIKDDILAGIVVAIIALPLGLAFGEMSQLGPEAGLWSAVVGGIFGGLFGGSRVGVSGPTAPMASQIAVFMGAFVIGTTNQPDIEAAFSIIFLSGLILIVISVLKISKFIHYIPYSAIAGFMCGIGLIIIFSQINSFLGLASKVSITKIFVDFSGSVNVEALYVSIPSLLILFLWSPIGKKIKFLINIPSSFAALILGTSIAYFMNLDIPYIGDKMGSMRDANIFSIYFPNLSRIPEFIGPAISLAGLAVLDSLLSCKVADNMTHTRHSSDRETFGQGLANMAAGLVGGISTATATTQTVGNITFGAKTPLSTIVKGLVILAVLFGLGSLVSSIPSACLAAILFKLGIEILDYRILPILRKIPIADLFIFSTVICLTIFTDIMLAVAVGVTCAFILYFKSLRLKYNHRNVPFSKSNFIIKSNDKFQLDELPIHILKPNEFIFFVSIENLVNTYAKAKEHKVLIIDMSDVRMIDLSGIYVLEDIIRNAQVKNIQAFISNINSDIEDILEKVGFFKNIGESNYHNSDTLINSIISKQSKI